MPTRFKAITIKPQDGGALMTRPSEDWPGIGNYRVKRDWRRDLDVEKRREGEAVFWPNKTKALGSQGAPAASDIILVHTARRANGQTALIVGTQTTLYRYFGLEDGLYYEAGYVVTDYIDENPGGWVVIGSGFSSDGKRWEAVNLNGYTFLNNAVDLPMTYRIEEGEVRPVYELREQGVASVGTIVAYNQMILAMDISEIKEDTLDDLLAPIDSGAITAYQTGSVSSGASTATQADASANVVANNDDFNGGNGFVAGMVGKFLRFTNGWEREILSITSPTIVVVATPYPADGLNTSAQPFQVVNRTTTADFLVNSSSAFFTAAMEGQDILWDSGETRRILEYISSTQVRVDSDLTIGPPQSETATVVGTIDSPVSQVETAVIAGTIDAAGAGNVEVIVTAAGMTGSPKTLLVAVANNDTAAQVAEKIRTDLGADGDITAFFTVSGSNENVILTRLAAAANDATMNIAVDNDTSTGLTPAPTSNDTTAGVADGTGNVEVIVTAVGMTGTPKTIQVAVSSGDTASDVAGKIRTALASDADVGHNTTGFFVVSGTGASVVLTRRAIAFNDATMNISVDDGTSAGLTAAPTSANTSVGPGLFSVTNPDAYTAFSDQSKINRIQYRLLTGMLNEPRRWGSSVTGSITAGSNIFTMDFPSQSFAVGQEVVVVGAGTLSGNLLATIVYVYQTTAILDTVAITAATDAEMQAADVSGSTIGFHDLEDDSSAILKALTLGGSVVVYKDTSIFVGDYTGNAASPIQFVRAYLGSKTLHFRHTLIEVGTSAHIYAGRNAFYKFDLTTRTPKEIEQFELVANLFFTRVGRDDQEDVFAADNTITKELFFCFPSSGSDKALCLDYLNWTISTTAAAYTAAKTIIRPAAGAVIGATEEWFVMGLSTGAMRVYGKTNLPDITTAYTASQSATTVTASSSFFVADHVGRSIKWADGTYSTITAYTSGTQVTVLGSQTRSAQAFTIVSEIYDRAGAAYDSVMASGMGDFGDMLNEKDVESFLVHLASQSPDTSIAFKLFGANNVSQTLTTLVDRSISTPKSKPRVSMFFRKHNFGDQLTVSGYNNPCIIAARTYNVIRARSESKVRRT